jgi:hypothetical protein
MVKGERAELEKLLQYIMRAPVSLERLSYGSDGKVTYRGHFHPRLGRDFQYVTAVEFLAMLVPHIQLRYECNTSYAGALSSTTRKRFGWIGEKATEGPPSPNVADDDESEFTRARKKNWARLIAKTWLENPELCPKCGKEMKVVAAISSPTQDDVIEKILRHIGAWDPPWQRQPKARAPPPSAGAHQEDSFSQLTLFAEEDLNQDAQGDDWLS